jgi:twitching motility protein PilT
MAMDSMFDQAVAAARRLGASDVHLKPDKQPILRIDGELRTLAKDERGAEVPALARDFLHNLAMSLLNDRRRDTLERVGDVTTSLATASGARQRIHISQQRGGISITMRLIPSQVPALDSLGLPAGARDLVAPGAGLVLVAAGPGGGRTTTLAALLDHLGAHQYRHVITIEDPVELLLKHRLGIVVQREIALDVPTAAAGLRAAARQDADVLMLSELADGETAALALSAAETGRLVLVGVPASSARDAVARFCELWDPPERPAIRARLRVALRGVLYQRLVAAKTGKGGRTAEAELLSGADAAADPV